VYHQVKGKKTGAWGPTDILKGGKEGTRKKNTGGSTCSALLEGEASKDRGGRPKERNLEINENNLGHLNNEERT